MPEKPSIIKQIIINCLILSLLTLSSLTGCGDEEDSKTLVFHGETYEYTEDDNKIYVDLGNSGTGEEQKYYIIINTDTRDVIDYNTPSKINPYEFAYAYYFNYE